MGRRALDRKGAEAYEEGRYDDAVRHYEELLARRGAGKGLNRVEVRFWLACCLHATGRLARAAKVLAPVCFNEAALREDPLYTYRAVTRAILIEIEAGQSLERIEKLMARANAIVDGDDELSEGRMRYVRGRLEASSGRFARARRLARSVLEMEPSGDSFAFSPLVRLAILCLLRARRHEEVAALIERWRHCHDPDAFSRPHLETAQAEWHWLRGEVDLAFAWALLANEEASGRQNLGGSIESASILVRSALAVGSLEHVEVGLAVLARSSRRAEGQSRFESDLARLDGLLGLVFVHAGIAPGSAGDSNGLPDGQVAPAANEAADATRVPGLLASAAVLIRRTQGQANSLDLVFGSRFRRRALRIRRQQLTRCVRAWKKVEATLLAAVDRADIGDEGEGTRPVADTTADPGGSPEAGDAAITQVETSAVRRVDEGFVLSLVMPTPRLPKVLEKVRERRGIRFVAYASSAKGGFEVEVFERRRWVARAHAEIDSEARPSQLVIRVDGASAPRWFEGLEAQARLSEARHLGERAERALRRGAPQEALAAWTAALAMRPGCARDWNRMAETAMALGRPEEARRHCLRSLELDGNIAETWDTLASILEAMGAGRRAVRKVYKIRDRRVELLESISQRRRRGRREPRLPGF